MYAKKINCAKSTLVSLLHNDNVVDIKLQLHCMSDHDSTVALKYIVMDKQEPDTDDDTPALGSSSSSDDVGVGRRVASSPSSSDSGEYNFDYRLPFAASSSRSSRASILTCALCGQTANKMCIRCSTPYCRAECQRKHWKREHRKHCPRTTMT